MPVCLPDVAVYALCPRCEGLPTDMIESLYCGIPLCRLNVRVFHRKFYKAPKFGCIVPMQDPDALATGTVGALDGFMPRADSDSWRRFEFKSIVDQYIDLLLTDKRN